MFFPSMNYYAFLFQYYFNILVSLWFRSCPWFVHVLLFSLRKINLYIRRGNSKYNTDFENVAKKAIATVLPPQYRGLVGGGGL